jgi:hypothetical protein
MIKPPIITLSPVSTIKRVEMFNTCAGVALGDAVAVGVALAVGVADAVAVAVGVAVAVAVAVGVGVGAITMTDSFVAPQAPAAELLLVSPL